ncbi:hypothetical protein GS584_08465 [Rhodococcus hoagii]|nr:hypothetical protein [Prescottella equi]
MKSTADKHVFDLEVTLRERDLRMGEAAGIDGVLTYSRDLFDHETVARWAAWLVRVLETVTDDPTVVVDAIDPVARGGVLGGDPRLWPNLAVGCVPG